MKKNIILYTIMGLLTIGCSDFLNIKPDQKMAVPHTLEDANLLLNDYSAMNSGYPTLGEVSADDYFLRTSNWQSISNMDERQAYLWQDEDIVNTVQWQNPYRTVYRSNQVLDVLRKLNLNDEPDKYIRIWGGAHFFRAFAFHQVAAVFAPVYDRAIARVELGIPLRLSPDLDYVSVRASLEETYKQIITDYKIAVQYLPSKESVLGRPSKAAAYAGLARTYLSMGEYESAYKYADSCLMIEYELLDYNTINPSASLPFARFNVEVVFPAITPSAGPLGQAFARIDTILYNSYLGNDIRKKAFFRHNSADGTHAFKGSYNNSAAGLFVGLTTGEMYLVRAEAAVRIGKIEQALADINHLLRHRWEKDVRYPEITEQNEENLLDIILAERRKELVYRGQRWTDLKRLNQDPRFAKTLIRNIDGREYRLEPNSPKYAIKIPYIVIEETRIEQNRR